MIQILAVNFALFVLVICSSSSCNLLFRVLQKVKAITKFILFHFANDKMHNSTAPVDNLKAANEKLADDAEGAVLFAKCVRLQYVPVLEPIFKPEMGTQ